MGKTLRPSTEPKRERERDRLKTRNEDGRRTYRIPRRRERRLPPGEEGSLEEEAAQHRRSLERKERKERCWRGEEVPGKVRQGPRLLRAPAPTARTHTHKCEELDLGSCAKTFF